MLIAPLLRLPNEVTGDWDVRASCKRHYWHDGSHESAILGNNKEGARRAAIAVAVQEEYFQSLLMTLRGMQSHGMLCILGWIRGYDDAHIVLSVPDPLPGEMVARLLKYPGVLSVEPDRARTAACNGLQPHLIRPHFVRSLESAVQAPCPKRTDRIDLPKLQEQDALRAIQIPTLQCDRQHDPYVVALIDDGIEWDHPYLVPHLWHNPKEIQGQALVDDDANGFTDDCIGWNFHTFSPDPRPSFGRYHGTRSAGLITAIANRAGLAVRLMAVRTHGQGNPLSLTDLAEAVRYASANGARTILLAQRWAIVSEDERERAQVAAFMSALDYAQHKGVLVVCAAGNDREDISIQRAEPATSGLSRSHVLTTQGIGPNFSRSGFASHGAEQLIVAPGGDNIRSIDVEGGTERLFYKTSAAAAIVAGISAVVATHKNIRDPAELKVRLLLCRDPAATDPSQLERRLINLRFLK